MAVTSREELVQYCYRKLGAPLVEINITDEQADDCVSEAMSFFRDYHWDGIEKMYFKHKITNEDITNKYVTLPNSIIGVNRVFPTSGLPTSSTNIFDLQYQLRMNDLRDLTSTSMIYYTQVMQHIALIDNLLNTYKQFRWNRLSNKLYIDQDWGTKLKLDEYILIDAYSVLDPDQSPKYWDERILKHYVTALMKKQWGSNIKKFGGITLPGGIQLDGQALYDEGKAEAEDIEQDIMGKQAPLEFVMG